MNEIELLESIGCYLEKAPNNKWCYKYQIKGKPLIITSDENKLDAAIKMVKEINETADIENNPLKIKI